MHPHHSMHPQASAVPELDAKAPALDRSWGKEEQPGSLNPIMSRYVPLITREKEKKKKASLSVASEVMQFILPVHRRLSTTFSCILEPCCAMCRRQGRILEADFSKHKRENIQRSFKKIRIRRLQ